MPAASCQASIPFLIQTVALSAIWRNSLLISGVEVRY